MNNTGIGGGLQDMDSTACLLEGASPCRFPRFSAPAHTTRAARRPIMASARVAIDLPDRDRLLSLSTEDAEEFGAVIRSAWALFLRCYTGQDDVTFGFQHHGTPEPIIARLALDDSVSVAATIERAKKGFSGSVTPVPVDTLRSRDRPLFDTAIVLWGFSKTSESSRVLAAVSLILLFIIIQNSGRRRHQQHMLTCKIQSDSPTPKAATPGQTQPDQHQLLFRMEPKSARHALSAG